MLWHGGDPAGWTRYKSLLVGIWFNSIGTGKIEDLRALLLRTPLLDSLYNTAIVPNKTTPGLPLGTDKIDTLQTTVDASKQILTYLYVFPTSSRAERDNLNDFFSVTNPDTSDTSSNSDSVAFGNSNQYKDASGTTLPS